MGDYILWNWSCDCYVIFQRNHYFSFMSLGIRRMHDIGRSGWWFGFLFIGSVFFFPVSLFLLYLCSKPLLHPHPVYL
ncbi:DUF805 domain-containing protein [Pantoea sp. DY-15]|nr:DUF805 domain-containing protein [Pantoea sp. DY-15]